jgi:hypothetical protein
MPHFNFTITWLPDRPFRNGFGFTICCQKYREGYQFIDEREEEEGEEEGAKLTDILQNHRGKTRGTQQHHTSFIQQVDRFEKWGEVFRLL